MVGAVKSNLGHSEGSSGLNSVAKVIIAFENKCVPANLHFNEPKQEIYAIVNKQIQPVIKNTRFPNGIVGVNSFGVGGVNVVVAAPPQDATRRLQTKKQTLDDAYAVPANFLEIDVCNPITHGVARNRYTDYEIRMRVCFFDFLLVFRNQLILFFTE